MIIYLISCVELQASDNEKGEIYQTLKKNLWKKRQTLDTFMFPKLEIGMTKSRRNKTLMLKYPYRRLGEGD